IFELVEAAGYSVWSGDGVGRRPARRGEIQRVHMNAGGVALRVAYVGTDEDHDGGPDRPVVIGWRALNLDRYPRDREILLAWLLEDLRRRVRIASAPPDDERDRAGLEAGRRRLSELLRETEALAQGGTP
ncbi:MAG: hypothetical protein ACE5HU_09230, partial [Acidobacteriota bacterium]